jgi:ADP-heptose:LPS heptosyltransferase
MFKLKKDKINKKIELWLKTKIGLFLYNNQNSPITLDNNHTEIIFNIENCKKILLIRHDRIGDLLVSVPFIRNLRKLLPQSEIDILLSKKNIGASPAIMKYIDKVWVYNKKLYSTLILIKKIRKKSFDFVIDLYDNSSVSAGLFVKLVNAKYSLGLDKGNRNIYNYTVPLKNKMEFHIVERIAQLLVPFGVDISNLDLSLEYFFSCEEISNANLLMGEKQKSVRFGINLTGSSKAKDWGIINNIEFIKRVYTSFPDVEIFIFGMKKVHELLEEISLKSGAKIAPTSNSFHEFAALLSTCDIILTPDTSAVHLAAAWKKPCIALYTFVDEHFGKPWTPYMAPTEVIITKEPNLDCITVDEVFKAFTTSKNKYLNRISLN